MLLYNILVEDEPFNWEPSACLYITYVATQFVASNLAGRVGCHRLWESSVRYLQPCRVVTTLYNGCKEIVIVVKLYISKVYHGLTALLAVIMISHYCLTNHTLHLMQDASHLNNYICDKRLMESFHGSDTDDDLDRVL